MALANAFALSCYMLVACVTEVPNREITGNTADIDPTPDDPSGTDLADASGTDRGDDASVANRPRFEGTPAADAGVPGVYAAVPGSIDGALVDARVPDAPRRVEPVPTDPPDLPPSPVASTGERGRVRVQNNTVVTDDGQLLRGAHGNYTNTFYKNLSWWEACGISMDSIQSDSTFESRIHPTPIASAI
jgi:hypothetical protein